MLRNQDNVPAFSLINEKGNTVTNKDYTGKPIVHLFVRGKFCPTTQRYLLDWQELFPRVKMLGAGLVAISYDSVENHNDLKERLGIGFPLLTDKDVGLGEACGLYVDTNKQGDRYCEPAVIITDKNGQVAYSVITSGPKGLPTPAELVTILIYMSQNDGLY